MRGLRIRGVGFAYHRSSPVLRGVDLELHPGELVCLLGPNGSGKSTLLRLAAGLSLPREGELNWQGQALQNIDRRERARTVAFLPQSLRVLYRYSVAEVVALGRHPHRSGAWGALSARDREAIQNAMERAQVAELAQRPFPELSGGERQRVLVASALAQGGQLLLLDEPTAALDLHHQLAVMSLLRELADAGRAVLCATHDLNLAAHHAHRLVLLHQGQVVAEGAATEVLRPELLEQVYGPGIWVGEHPEGQGIAVLPKARGGRS